MEAVPSIREEEQAEIEKDLELDLKSAELASDSSAQPDRRNELSPYFAMMRRFPPLREREDFDRLHDRYRSATTAEERRQAEEYLIAGNVGLALAISRRYLGLGVSRAELVQHGLIVLYRKALPMFDPSRGFRFSTYATWWIRQAMHRAIHDSRLDRPYRIPVHQQESMAGIHEARKRFVNEHGCQPNTRELLTALHALPMAYAKAITKKQLDTLLRHEVRVPRSLSEPRHEDNVGTFGDTLADKDDRGVFPTNDKIEIQEKKRRCLDVLKQLLLLILKLEIILRMRFGLQCQPMTLEAIGLRFDVTRERIRQIEMSALKKLAFRLRMKRDEVEGWLCAASEYGWADDFAFRGIPEELASPSTTGACDVESAFRRFSEHACDTHGGEPYLVFAPLRTLSVRLECPTQQARSFLEVFLERGWIAPLEGKDAVRLARTEFIPKPDDVVVTEEEPDLDVSGPTPLLPPPPPPPLVHKKERPYRQSKDEFIAQAVDILSASSVLVSGESVVRGAAPLLAIRLKIRPRIAAELLQALSERGSIVGKDGWRTVVVLPELIPQPEAQPIPEPEVLVIEPTPPVVEVPQTDEQLEQYQAKIRELEAEIARLSPPPVSPPRVPWLTIEELCATFRLERRVVNARLRQFQVPARIEDNLIRFDPELARQSCADLLLLPRAGKDGVWRTPHGWWVVERELPKRLNLPAVLVFNRIQGKVEVRDGLTKDGTPTRLYPWTEAKAELKDLLDLPVVSVQQDTWSDAEGAWCTAEAFSERLRKLGGLKVGSRWLATLGSRIRTRAFRDKRGNVRTFYSARDLSDLIQRRLQKSSIKL